MSSTSTTNFVSDVLPTSSAPRSSTTSSSNTANADRFPKIIFELMEQGLQSPDAQIERLLTNLKYPQNIYALKYILEHNGDSVSVEMLDSALKSLCSQEFDN